MDLYKNYIIYILILLGSSLLVSCNSNKHEKSFTEVTGIEFPETAEFSIKIENSPDFHGDYGTLSIIQMENDDYIKLTQTLEKNGLKEDENEIMVNEFLGGKELLDSLIIERQYSVTTTSKYHFVGFLSDKESILIIRSHW